MVNVEKDKYNELKNLLETRVDECSKILISTNELKKMLQNGSDEDLIIKKMQERGILINKASSFNEDCHSIAEFIGCINDEVKKSLFEELIRKIQQLLDGTTILDKENKLLIENKMNKISLHLKKIQESKQLTRSLNKTVIDNPSFIDVCG